MKTGNTRSGFTVLGRGTVPQWSPVMKTGNTFSGLQKPRHLPRASMEPGHEDREYISTAAGAKYVTWPQWSPVMKTGNTRRMPRGSTGTFPASMEPGHEDREYNKDFLIAVTKTIASMEPGHEDREYGVHPVVVHVGNGASMEPGHEDREYAASSRQSSFTAAPQWSPVMKTGNTRAG